MHRNSLQDVHAQHAATTVAVRVVDRLTNSSRIWSRHAHADTHHIHTCVSLRMCVCMYHYMHTSVCVCVYVLLYACMHACMCVCMHVCVYIYVCIPTHTNKHARAHTHKHTYSLTRKNGGCIKSTRPRRQLSPASHPRGFPPKQTQPSLRRPRTRPAGRGSLKRNCGNCWASFMRVGRECRRLRHSSG